MNSVFFRLNFNTCKKYILSNFDCWLLPKKLAFAREIMALPETGGCSPPNQWLVYAYEFPQIVIFIVDFYRAMLAQSAVMRQ